MDCFKFSVGDSVCVAINRQQHGGIVVGRSYSELALRHNAVKYIDKEKLSDELSDLHKTKLYRVYIGNIDKEYEVHENKIKHIEE